MHVFIAGGTGALGRALVPLLRRQGHAVRLLVRSPQGAAATALAAEGCDLVAGDLLDAAPSTLRRAAEGCDAVLHLATAIPKDPTAPGAWVPTARLRTEGTRALLDAALEAGARRYVQQSIVMAYADGGERWLEEDWPLDVSPAREAICGPVREMERLVRAVPPERLTWTILRGGLFVGPGTGQQALLERLRAGTEIVAGEGRSFLSPIHVRDMASAVATALERAPAGSTFNGVAEPVRQGEYLDRLAALAGAPPPRRDPQRPPPPSFRCSNRAAREHLGWAPIEELWPGGGEPGATAGTPRPR